MIVVSSPVVRYFVYSLECRVLSMISWYIIVIMQLLYSQIFVYSLEYRAASRSPCDAT